MAVAVYAGNADLPYPGVIDSLNASSPNCFLDLPAWLRLAEVIKDFDPDIVQANAGDTLKYAVFSKIFFGWKNKIISRNASEMGCI